MTQLDHFGGSLHGHWPITWLTLTNKTVQENTQTKNNPKKQTMQNTAKQIYPGSVTSYNTQDSKTRWAYSTMLLNPHGGYNQYNFVLV